MAYKKVLDPNRFDCQNTCFVCLPHHAIFNNAKTEKLTDGNELFFDSTYPLPYIVSDYSYCKLHQPDPVTHLFKEMEEFEKTRLTLKKKCAKDAHVLKNYTLQESLDDPPEVSENVTNYMEHLMNDPHPNFPKNVDFNYLMMGGNLDVIKLADGEECFIQPFYDDDKRTCFQKINVNPHKLLQHPGFASKETKDFYVYEILNSVGVQREDDIDIALRQKKQFIFASSIDRNTRKTRYCEYFEWPKTLLGGAFVNSDEFTFLDHDNTLTKISLSELEANFTKDLKLESDYKYPLTVREWDHNQVTLTEPLHLSIFDFRQDQPTKLLTQGTSYFECERYCIQAKSQMLNNVLYVGTTHSLYGYDIRSTAAPLFSWAHQLKKSPTMLKIEKFAGNEVICISSNMIGDLKIFNVLPAEDLKINRLHMRPKSIRNSFEECRLRGKFLKDEHLAEHLRLSVTGIALVNEYDVNLHLFTQNFLNDVFHSTLLATEMVVEQPRLFKRLASFKESVITRYQEYEEVVSKHEQVPEDNHYFLRKLRTARQFKELFRKPIEETERTPTPENVRPPKQPWEVSIEQLKKYKDVLASDLLSVWDVDLEEDLTERPFFQELDSADPAPSMTATWISNTICKEEVDIKDVVMIDDQPYELADTSRLVKNAAKRKSYVKGF